MRLLCCLKFLFGISLVTCCVWYGLFWFDLLIVLFDLYVSFAGYMLCLILAGLLWLLCWFIWYCCCLWVIVYVWAGLCGCLCATFHVAFCGFVFWLCLVIFCVRCLGIFGLEWFGWLVFGLNWICTYILVYYFRLAVCFIVLFVCVIDVCAWLWVCLVILVVLWLFYVVTCFWVSLLVCVTCLLLFDCCVCFLFICDLFVCLLVLCTGCFVCWFVFVCLGCLVIIVGVVVF